VSAKRTQFCAGRFGGRPDVKQLFEARTRFPDPIPAAAPATRNAVPNKKGLTNWQPECLGVPLGCPLSTGSSDAIDLNNQGRKSADTKTASPEKKVRGVSKKSRTWKPVRANGTYLGVSVFGIWDTL